MNDYQVAFRVPLNWETVTVIFGLVAGIVAFIMMNGTKYDKPLFHMREFVLGTKKKTWITFREKDFQLSWLVIPAGIVLGIILAAVLWGAGVRQSFREPLTVAKYAVMIVTGMVVAVISGAFIAKHKGLKPDLALDIALLAIPLGIIGARAWFAIFPYKGQPHGINSFVDFFKIWEGGLGIYGGIIGGVLGIVLVSLWRKVNLLKLLDITAPCVMIAQAIGRWGNFFNQEAYGLFVANPAMHWFPLSVLIEHPKNPGDVVGWYLATFFYESLWNVIGYIGLMLFTYHKRNKIDGLVTCGYFLWYGIGRSWIEELRLDSLYIGSLRVSVLFSIIMIVVSLAAGAFLVWNYYQKRKKTPPAEPKEEDGSGGEENV